MDEMVPVVLGVVLGASIWRAGRGATRTVLSVLAVIVCGAFATVLSGEVSRKLALSAARPG
jgi:hypothetical protein